MKNIVVKEESAFFLWEEGDIGGNNIGIVWDQEYAELINVALKFYKEHHKEESQ